ncbi:MAG: very short patch repair endonuclease [Flavobacteriales bacterium]|nr:very short patch repair endonuclease [Flavobacteriales bacterium]
MPRRRPKPANAHVSLTMSRIRAKDTKPELIVRACLRAAGLTGYRLHYAKAPGRPDIAFVNRKLAVFVHGCFWHGCPHCQPPKPKRNSWYWGPKLERNQERDGEKAAALRREGWRVITLWECRIKRTPDAQVARVLRAYDARTAVRRSASRRPRKN